MQKDLQDHFLQNEYINERMFKMSFQSIVARHINRHIFFQEIHLKLCSFKYKIKKDSQALHAILYMSSQHYISSWSLKRQLSHGVKNSMKKNRNLFIKKEICDQVNLWKILSLWLNCIEQTEDCVMPAKLSNTSLCFVGAEWFHILQTSSNDSPGENNLVIIEIGELINAFCFSQLLIASIFF